MLRPVKIVETVEANETLAEYASGLTEEPVIITSNGQPIAALVTLENVGMETISLSSNSKFIKLIKRSRAQRHSKGGVSSTKMRHRLGLSEVQQFKSSGWLRAIGAEFEIVYRH